MPDSPATSVCPQCERPLPPDAPRGLCAKCLFEAMLKGPLNQPPQANQGKPSLPRAFGAYELLEELARGGMGVVYRARQVGLNRLVALKVIRDSQLASPQAVQRFQIEAEAAAKLHHPNIVPIYEFGEVDGQHFLSMELVEGADLVKQMRGTPMESRPLARLMATIAHAIHHAHQRGVLHRDLKPANVLLDASLQPKVTDFGLAKLTGQDSALTLSSDVLGSPNYMAPEQAVGGSDEVTMAADVYSLGAIMYELLTGRAPFRAKTPLETLRKVMDEQPQTPRSLYKFADTDLETICLKCMEKRPEQRYGSAEALAEDLERWLRKEPIQARPVGQAERVGKWVRRNPVIATLGALLLLALATGLGAVLTMNVRLSSANHQKDVANVQLSTKLRDFEWQKVEDLVAAGKRGDALALLSSMLRRNPQDEVAATRIFAMLNGGNFGLPRAAPFQHEALVHSVSVSADGRRVLTGCSDGKARLWDVQGGSLLTSLVHTGKVTSARFADDDRLIVTQCQDGTFWLWDSDGARMLLESSQPPNWTVPPTFSRDRKRVALPDTDNSLRIWDLPKRRSFCSIQSPVRIMHAAFSTDPNILAVSGKDGSIVIWSISDSRPAEVLVKLSVSCEPKESEFSSDGRTLVTTCTQHSITFWDTQTWAKVKEFKAHEGDILMSKLTPDGRRLIVAPWNEPLRIWDVSSGKTIGQPIEAEQPHCYFRLSPDGERLATFSQSGVVRVWDATTGRALSEPIEHEGPITDLTFMPDGRSLLSSSQDGTAQVWDIQYGRPALSILKAERPYSSACFSPDGRYVFGTDGARALKFDASTGIQVGKPIVHADPIYRMKVSPDGKKLVTATWDNTARVWDSLTGDAQTPLLQHRDRLLGVAFSPDSRLVATASQDTTARLWDAESGEPRSPPLRHDADVLYVAFSSDSRMLLSASVDGTVRLWSTKDGSPGWPEPIRHKGIVWTAEFDPKGERIVTASADRSAMIWDVRSSRPLIRPIRHERGVSGARFSPDGRWVLTWSDDGTARVWDSQNGAPVSQPMQHSDKVTLADFSPDGARVLTGSKDGVVRLWDAFTGYPLSEPLENGGSINVVEFSPDGRRFLGLANQSALRIWEVATPPVPVPGWFCDLVEVLAEKHLTAKRDVEPVSRASLQPFRQRFASIQDSDFYSRWAKWFLWERMKDPVPEFVP